MELKSYYYYLRMSTHIYELLSKQVAHNKDKQNLQRA